MAIEVEVTLYCDECNGQEYEGQVCGASVGEVKAKAHEMGWVFNRHGHFCRCNVNGWAGEKYRARKEDEMSMGDRWRAAAELLLQDR